jgi:hypothetical protein
MIISNLLKTKPNLRSAQNHFYLNHMRIVAFCFFFILQGPFCATAQNIKNSTLAMQTAKLKNFLDQHSMEKVYLHFDKPYYAAGDTIYFKAYVIAGERNALSPLSGVLYADLVTPNNKIARAIKLQVIDGLAWGDITLPDSLPGGNYRIRAYTKLMQNYGSELFFDRVIPVGAIIKMPVAKGGAKPAKSNTIATTLPDMQFFPEGGEMVAGVASKIAFKAIVTGGGGINVSGTIFNNNNQPVAKFVSAHLGMGAVNITPVAGQTYYAEVVYGNGAKASVALPAANTDGVAIAVFDSTSKISVHINPSKGFYEQNKGQPLGLFIYSGGRLTTVSDVMDGTDMRFDIQKSGLHSGITQITLLSAKGEPLCERLVFINKKDKQDLSLSTDKMVYQQREKVQVSFHVENTGFEVAPAHFSVAVIDRSKVLVNEDKEENILTYLLLTSCLKGNIEEPGYYFNNTDDKKRAELDLVMLTHGYRRFTWKALANNDVPPPTAAPEKNLSIAGTAKSLWGKPIDNALITLIPQAGGNLLSEKTDKSGAFNFSNLVFYDSTRFVINAVNAKGKNNTQLIYHLEPPAPVAAPNYFASADTSSAGIIQAYMQNSKNRHEQFLKYYNKGIQLKEVKIQAVKKAGYHTQSLAGAGNADQVIHMRDLKVGGQLSNVLNGRLRGGVVFNQGRAISSTEHAGLLVVLDGVMQGSYVDDINPLDVETVELLSPLTAKGAIYGMMGAHGVLIITTKRGSGLQPEDMVSRGVLPLTLNGFYRAREFYAPRYDYVNNHIRPDLRSTIYWLPEITTDKDGNANFDFYNADGVGQYQIIIEGINNAGTAGAAKLSYNVTE